MAAEQFEVCPRCGKDLTPGFLRSGQRTILWTPSDKHRGIRLPETEEEFELPGGRLWRGACCPSQYCKHCGLIFIETKEESS